MSGVLTAVSTVVLTGIVLCTCLHMGVVVALMAIRRGKAPHPEEVLPPVTWFRPLKSGVRDLRAKLDAFIDALAPGDQVLLGVDPHSESGEIAAEVASRAGKG